MARTEGAAASPRGLAAETVCREGVEIAAPALLVFEAELVEIGPGIDPGIVEIVEGDAHRIVADRLQRDDPDMGAAGDQCLLAGSVTLDFGRWALDAQIFGREAEPATVVVGDLEQLLGFFETQLDRPARRPAGAHTGSSGRRRLRRYLIVAQPACLVDQHDRDAVTDRIGEPRLLADQFLGFAVVAHGR